MSNGHCVSDSELGAIRDRKMKNSGPAHWEQSKYDTRQREQHWYTSV